VLFPGDDVKGRFPDFIFVLLYKIAMDENTGQSNKNYSPLSIKFF
jgi:hypothetical protein